MRATGPPRFGDTHPPQTCLEPSRDRVQPHQPTSYLDPRPAAEVIPIGTRAATVDPALVSLAAAAVATEVSDECLWLEYVTLDGSRSLEWFRAHLESPTVADADTLAEHEIVVQMFTELFADEDIPLRVQ